MEGLLLIIIINIITGFITYITSTGKIIDRRRKGFSKILKEGRVLLGCILTTVLLAIWQFYYTQAKEKNDLIEVKREQGRRDSIARIEREQSNLLIITTFTKALAVYGLKYDSAQKKIEKIVSDSANRKTTIIQGANPVFTFCPEGGVVEVSGDTMNFKLHYCFENAPFNVKATLYILAAINGKYQPRIKDDQSIINKNGLELAGAVEQGPTYKMIFPSGTRFICFYLIGGFTNQDKSKSYPIDIVYTYDIQMKKFAKEGEAESEKIRDIVKLNP